MLLRVEPRGLFSWPFLNSSHLLPFLLFNPLFLQPLTGSTSCSADFRSSNQNKLFHNLIAHFVGLETPGFCIRRGKTGGRRQAPLALFRSSPLRGARFVSERAKPKPDYRPPGVTRGDMTLPDGENRLALIVSRRHDRAWLEEVRSRVATGHSCSGSRCSTSG